MACPTCGNSILFGGIKDGKTKYCRKKCYESDEVNRVASTIPDRVVEAFSKNLHNGNCPKCNGVGPVDIHKSYSVYSVLLYTKWQTNEHIFCKKCASKQQKTDLAGSLLLGWWGIPFGLIVTPIIISMNIVAMLQNPGVKGPTKALKQRSRSILAAQQMEST
jgi:hypothetical protein